MAGPVVEIKEAADSSQVAVDEARSVESPDSFALSALPTAVDPEEVFREQSQAMRELEGLDLTLEEITNPDEIDRGSQRGLDLERATELLRPDRQLVLEGNPAIGSLVVLKQVHFSLATNSNAVMQQTALHQYAIFSELTGDDARVVFSEGRSEALSERVQRVIAGTATEEDYEAYFKVPPTSEESFDFEAVSDIQEAFPDGMPAVGELSPEQIQTLYFHGGALVYAVLNPNKVPSGVAVLPTSAPALEEVIQDELQRLDTELEQHRELLWKEIDECFERIEAALNAGTPTEELEKELQARQENYNQAIQTLEQRVDLWQMVVREQVAIANVQQYLKEHPGERVHLIYGQAHVWGANDFDQGEAAQLPYVEARYFRSVVEQIPDDGSWAFNPQSEQFQTALQSEEGIQSIRAEQERLVSGAKHIGWPMLRLLPDLELRLAALEKLLPDHYSTPEDYRENLLGMSSAPEWTQAVTRHFEQRTGPFDYEGDRRD